MSVASSVATSTIRRWARRGLTVLGALALLSMVASSFAAATSVGIPTPLSPTAATGVHANPSLTLASALARSGGASHTSHVAAARPLAGPPPPTGRGIFFDNSTVPAVPAANQSCYNSGTSCNSMNVTNDPSLNYTSSGLLAVAYTAYTNVSPCGRDNYSFTEIGFSSSSNGGTTWATPTYLGNPVCNNASQQRNFTNAWEPSLTSLSNGTLVLAYIEYNASDGKNSTAHCPFYPPNAYFGPSQYYCGYNILADRLVVTESYNNGANWTTPTVLNSSYNPNLNNSTSAPLRPWITAVGNTVYLAWENVTSSPYYIYNFGTGKYHGVGSSQVNLFVSKNGGASWGPRIDLKTVKQNKTSSALNPFVTVNSTGAVLVSYTTDYNFTYMHCVLNNTICYYDTFLEDVELATSVNNGTNWTYHVVVHQAFAQYNYASVMQPETQIAASPVNGKLYVVYTQLYPKQYCYTFGCYYYWVTGLFLAESTNGGAAWTQSFLGAGLTGTGTYFVVSNPAIAVDAFGTVHVETNFINGSICVKQAIYGFTICGAHTEVYFNSTNNGTSWTGPILLNYSLQTEFDPYAPDGEYATIATGGHQVFLGWTNDSCANSTLMSSTYYYCYYWPPYYANPPLTAQVHVSSLYRGAGVALTFHETGVQIGTRWSVNVQGNARSGIAPVNLTVSGVPPNEPVNWTVPSPSGGYGVRYFATGSMVPPAAFTTSTTITESFAEQVLVNLTTVPHLATWTSTYLYCFGGNGFYWGIPGCPGVNYNLTPLPGAEWLPAGTPVVFNATYHNIFGTTCGAYTTYCYDDEFLNVSFESWTGNGAGSFNSTNNFTTIVANAPFNETANFHVWGWCYYSYTYSTGACQNENASVLFHETGLPKGTSWTVTVNGNNATTQVSNSTPFISITSNATLGVFGYYAWTIPGPTTGMYWVPQMSPVSPGELPLDGVVNVHYVLQNISTDQFPIVVAATGLPSNDSWTVNLDGTSYGVQSGTFNGTLSGGTHTVTGGNVYTESGTSYYVSSVSEEPFVENWTWTNSSTLPMSFTSAGSSFVYLHYSPMYYVQVAGSTGGAATPGSAYVDAGTTVQLNVTVMPHYHFVGWTGIGVGSTTTTTPNPKIVPAGPVQELATFAHNPSLTWNLTVATTGLPAGVAASVIVGGRTYAGTGSFNVPGLVNGTYPVMALVAYLNGTDLTRYVPVITGSTYPGSPAGYQVNGSGTVNVAYTTQYAVNLESTGPGTISPVAGVYYYTAGTQIVLNATPGSGDWVNGWNGSGSGSVTTPSHTHSVTLTVNSPVTETVLFGIRPPTIPATYQLTVYAQNLPTGVPWSVALAGTGASGTSASLTVGSLNGTYTVSFPTVYVGSTAATSTTRYVANVTSSETVNVTKNASVNVSYQKQYLVTVTVGSGGSANVGTSWVNAGSSVTLTATANATSKFENWSGQGAGAVSGTTATITVPVNGPVTETANFAPVYATQSTGSPTAGLPIAAGLLVALLIVGLLVGLLASRGRKPPAAPAEEPMPMGAPAEPAGGEIYAEGPPPVPEGEPAPYDESVP